MDFDKFLSEGSETSALSIIDSTDDVFQEFCDAQVELVVRALGRGARCMLYLRSVSADGDSLQLAEVASYPRSSRSSSGNGAVGASAWEMGEALRDSDEFGAAATSFVELAGNEASTSGRGNSSAGGPGQAITLSGSIDDSEGQSTAAEALLVKQRVFALPSANALVVPLSRDDTLVGLLVGEMPEGRVSSRVRKERVKAASVGEVEVLSAASSHADEDEEKEKEAAADTAAQFGERRQAALTAAAKSIVAAGLAKRCIVQLSYAIGVPEPLSVFVDTYGTGSIPDDEILAKVKAAVDFRPGPIGRDLDLKRSNSKTSGKNNRYQQTAAYGHFGRDDYDVFTWEKPVAL